MSFVAVSFSPSSTVTDLAQGVAQSLESLKESITEGVGALRELELPASSPLDALEQIKKAAGRAAQSMASPAAFLAVTPFQYTVGTRTGEYGYLTPENALKTLAGRFDEAESGSESSDAAISKSLVILMVASQSPAALGEALEGFAKVYPIAELQKVCRRAKALANLETDKFVIPQTPSFPPWKAASPRMDAKGREVAQALDGMLAQAEGLAQTALAPLEQLADFAGRQAGIIAQKAADLAKLAESMSGGMDAWIGLSLSGTGAEIFRELSRVEAPFDASFKNTALLCWYGDPAQVAYYKESFGL